MPRTKAIDSSRFVRRSPSEMTFPRSVRPHWRATDFVPATAGLLAGAAGVLNHFAELPALAYDRKKVLGSLALSAIASAAAFVLSHRLILRSFAPPAPPGSAAGAAFARRQAATYLVFLLFVVGSTGFRMPGIVFSASIVALFALSNALL